MINNRKEDKGDHYTEVNSSLLYKPLFQVTPSQNPLIHPTAVHMPILNTDEIIKTKQEINVLIDRLSGHKVPKKKESKTSTDEDYHLGEKLAGDVLSAVATSFCVAPFITIVDKAIVQRAAGSHTISQSVLASVSNIARHPITYIRSPFFLMMWSVYASTYCTANMLKTLIEHEEIVAKKQKTVPPPDKDMREFESFALTTLVNSGTSLMKDSAYAKMFGTSGASNFPMVTYGLWGLRDCVVISSSFVFPEIMGKYLVETSNMDKKEAMSISQLVCPVVAQIFATPLQLLGLDMYNRPMANTSMYSSIKDRLSFIKNNFSSVTSARVARIAPAFGIGGIGNTYLRDHWREMLIRKEALKSIETQHDGMRRYHTRRLVGLLATKHAGKHMHEANHL